MNATQQGSGRRSSRVEHPGHNLAGTGAAGPISAPEGSTRWSSPPVHPERATRRVGGRKLEVIRADLSARDWDILGSLAEHPYLRTRHLLLLHFTDHLNSDTAARICRRVLRRLTTRRVIEHLDRRVGGVRAGSASYIWRLGPVGDRLVRQASGDGIRARRKEPSIRHVDHCLAIADAHLALIEAARERRFELVRVETEPSCWRPYLGSSGAREVLRPDLYAVSAIGDFEDHWLIEVDRGTESIPTLIRKCTQYEAYRRTGREQQVVGVFPRVLWLLPDEVRIAKLHAALRAARRIDPTLFRLTTIEHLVHAVTGGRP
jgi:hypothetical protein